MFIQLRGGHVLAHFDFNDAESRDVNLWLSGAYGVAILNVFIENASYLKIVKY